MTNGNMGGMNGSDSTGGKGVVFKGSMEGLAIVVPDGCTFEQLYAEVTEKIHTSSRFFKGAKLKVTYRGVRLTDDEEQRLYRLLSETSGAVIESLSAQNEEQESHGRRAPDVPTSMMKRFFSKNPDEGECRFIRSTVRGGTRIEFDGSVVVLGDVNPGAEIVAAKHVVVLGVLRGMIHAGADGSPDAFIYALKLRPTQLRIGDLAARSPDGEPDSGICPEMATVKDGAIYVSPVNERL